MRLNQGGKMVKEYTTKPETVEAVQVTANPKELQELKEFVDAKLMFPYNGDYIQVQLKDERIYLASKGDYFYRKKGQTTIWFEQGAKFREKFVEV